MNGCLQTRNVGFAICVWGLATTGCAHASASDSEDRDLGTQGMLSDVATLRDQAYCAALHVEVLSDVVVDSRRLAARRIAARKSALPREAGPNLSQASAAMSANLSAVAQARATFRTTGVAPPAEFRTPRFSLQEYRSSVRTQGPTGTSPEGISAERIRFVAAWTDYHDPILGDAQRRLMGAWLQAQASEDPELMEDYYRAFHEYLAGPCQPEG